MSQKIHPFSRYFVLATLMVSTLSAQVVVQMKPAKPNFVANEPIEMVLMLTNNAGRPLTLKNEGGLGWLDINVTNQSGVQMSPRRGAPSFSAVSLPAGQTIRQTIRISSLYPLNKEGSYRAQARVRLPGSGRSAFMSNSVMFNVTGAFKFLSRRAGTKSGVTIDYHLMKTSSGRKTELFVQIDQVVSGRTLGAFSLGEALYFYKPQGAVSGKGTFHVLYQKTPTLYRHVEVNALAKVVNTKFYKRGAAGLPKLISFANGEVKVSGAVPYDINKKVQQRANRRNLSDRPSVIY